MLEARQKREPFSSWVFAGEGGESHLLVTSLDHIHAKIARPVVKGNRNSSVLQRIRSAFPSPHHVDQIGRGGCRCVYNHRPHRTVTISGNHSPLPMIVSVTHQSLEPGMVGLIIFQEVL
jgi:hypothetical protein